MGRVRQKGTAAELRVQQVLQDLGIAFRANAQDLPGSPDIVIPTQKLTLFVHGCFWHRHAGCKASTTPKSNTAFWTDKFARNQARDRRKAAHLRRLGYSVLVIWECQTKKPDRLERVARRLENKLRNMSL
jgi:DNA mismatch endonuclease (patch repair protein)